jgi:hypothetical protein
MAYLDHLLKARNARLLSGGKILKGERRQHVVQKAMDLLDDWRVSPWENEGAARHGLRSALCVLGHGWSPADEEAAGVILAALKRLGRSERPSWLEGQPHYLDSYDQCSWCKAPLDDLQVARSERFCSTVCAQAAFSRRDYLTHANADAMGRQAYRILQQAKTKPRTCQHCGVTYHAIREGSDQKVCSTRCRDASMRMIPDRQCLNCGCCFRPEKMARMHCSPKCAAEHRFAAARIEKSCACCGVPFAAKISTAMFCSNACKKKRWKARRKTADILQFKPLTPRVFDVLFKRAA